MSLGIVEKPFALAPWTTPPIINSFLVTGDFKAVILQVVCFLVTAIVYYPFFKVWDRAKVREENSADSVSRVSINNSISAK
jgi:PTS system cellobiose-specific IIC component